MGDEAALSAEKAELRQRMRALRKGLSPEALDAAGRAVAEAVLRLPELGTPTTVACYLAVRKELPTSPLLQALIAAGHQIAVPRVSDQRMEMRAWDPDVPLVPGALGIPTTDGGVVDRVAVAICPGLAFDPSGRRLGYGGGFYDRWLVEAGAVPIGVGVDEAVVDRVPAGPTDQRMAVVVTPRRTIRASS